MSGPGAKRYSLRSKKKRTSYSHISAAYVLQSIGKEELIKKFKPMLTDHRTVLLEDRYLIDSDCRDSIQAKLRLGQHAGAATELVEYFEANHDGDKMMEFCTFLEDQAGNTSPQLVQLANTIEECVNTLSAAVSGPSQVQRASNPKMVSYSHVRARDVMKSFKWDELRKDIENMLTKSRVDTLERGYNLIDSPCNAKIEGQLTNGDPAAAVTTLLDYFEANHDGDGMLRFCTFLRDESEEAGGSAVLEGLADRIERAVKELGASQAMVTIMAKGENERQLQKYEDLVDRNYDPFHEICTEGVSFSNRRLVATSSLACGVVFSVRPIPLVGMFQVKLLDRGDCRFHAIGFTLEDPDNIDPGFLNFHNLVANAAYWLFHGSTSELVEGSSIGCCITRGGDLEIYINGQMRVVGRRNVPVDRPLWGVVIMRGEAVTIQSEFYCVPIVR